MQILDYSTTVGTTPLQVIDGLDKLSPGMRYLKLVNVSPSDGPTIWLSRATNTPAANMPGCYPLAPGDSEEFIQTQFTLPPTNRVWAVATGADAALTISVGVGN